jgi:ATP-binding cassette subfamily F protein uup
VLRLLLTEPNVLLLDEPTNDLDIETLTVVEDFLDDWPGTLVVVSHDRYFLERVCDSVWALLGDGQVSMLPGGVEEYLERRTASADRRTSPEPAARSAPGDAGPRSADLDDLGRSRSPADVRAAKKELARVERQLARVSERIDNVHAAMIEHATDFVRLEELDREVRELTAEQHELEHQWLVVAERVESG